MVFRQWYEETELEKETYNKNVLRAPQLIVASSEAACHNLETAVSEERLKQWANPISCFVTE